MQKIGAGTKAFPRQPLTVKHQPCCPLSILPVDGIASWSTATLSKDTIALAKVSTLIVVFLCSTFCDNRIEVDRKHTCPLV
jgi:hypothetical protein